MTNLFSAATIILALIGYCFGILNFLWFWKYRAGAMKLNDGAIRFSPKVKQSPDFHAMRRCWWAFVAWFVGTIVVCNIILPYLKGLFT